jgi:hypothetical protein
MGATNRKDVLDAALTRPGRFDRSIEVRRPEFAGRIECCQVGWVVQACSTCRIAPTPPSHPTQPFAPAQEASLS